MAVDIEQYFHRFAVTLYVHDNVTIYDAVVEPLQFRNSFMDAILEGIGNLKMASCDDGSHGMLLRVTWWMGMGYGAGSREPSLVKRET